MKTQMNKTIKNCLRKLFCNFCFMLLGTFSKAEKFILLEVNNKYCSIESTKIPNYSNFDPTLTKNANNEKNAKKISYNKKAFATFPKKRKKIAPQDSFEIRELPKGEYTAQIDNDSNIIITKKIMVLK
jgi:hypothetical protein